MYALSSLKNVTHEDSRKLRELGRNFAITKMHQLVAEAAELLAIATPSERSYLMSEFEEGVRNNVPDMNAYNNAMWAVRDRTNYLLNNLKE